MHYLRWLFLLACLGCVVLVAWNGRWDGYLTWGNITWVVELRRAPVWSPPPQPVYARFQTDFKESEGFPPEGTPGLAIKRVLNVDAMAIDLVLYLWPVTLISGSLYLGIRGKRRDLTLHCGLAAGIGLIGAAVACVGLWLFIGGWGPPAPEFFGGLGLVVGIVAGFVSFKRESADRFAAADR